MISKGWQTLRTGGKRRWTLALGALALIVVASMIIGVIANLKPESSSSERTSSTYSYPAPAATAAPAAKPPVASSGGSATSSGGSNSAPAPGSSASGSIGSAADQQQLPADRLIIRTATVSLTADDVERTLQDVRALAAEKTGVVFQSSSTIRNERTYATLTIQVPSATFDDTMNRLRKLTGVKVASEDATSQDVTEEYVDLTAQLTNLKATETELVRLLGKTTSVSEILSVQREISSVRGEIDRRQGRINYLEKKTALSSITVTIAPVLPANLKTTETKGFDPLEVLGTAWAGSLKGLQGLYTVAVTLGVWLVWLGPLFLIGWLVFRRVFKSKPSNPPAPDPVA